MQSQMFKDFKAAAATQAKKKGKEQAPKKEEKKTAMASGVQAKVARTDGAKTKKHRKERRKDQRKERRRDIKRRVKEEKLKLQEPSTTKDEWLYII